MPAIKQEKVVAPPSLEQPSPPALDCTPSYPSPATGFFPTAVTTESLYETMSQNYPALTSSLGTAPFNIPYRTHMLYFGKEY